MSQLGVGATRERGDALRPSAAPSPGGSWTWRISRDRPWALPLLGVGASVAFLASWLALVAAIDPSTMGSRIAAIPLWASTGSWKEALVRALLIGYTFTLAALGQRAALRRLAELGPAMAGGANAFERERARLLAVGRPWSLVCGAAGVLAHGCIYLFIVADSEPLARAAYVFWFVLFGWVLGSAVYVHLHLVRALSVVGAQTLEIDLLDLRPSMPLVRFGLELVLLWVVWMAIMSLFWADPGPKNWVNALGLVPLTGIAGAAFFGPVWGVHRRIRDARRTELARLRDAIRAERDRMRDASGGDARLANLIAYRGLIHDVREWPFDVSSLLRFALYLLLGGASWIGAALVERGLGRVLE